MATISTWEDSRPSPVTIPGEWNYTDPCGIVYPEKPSELVAEFIGAVDELSNFDK